MAAAAATPARPRVGMGVIVMREDGKICIGQRINSLGHGEWALPGGHLEHGEQLDACAVRETEEETGIVLPCAQLVAVENVIFPAGEAAAGTGPHYVVLFMQGMAPPGSEPRVLEANKCAQWAWAEWGELKEGQRYAPLFLPLQQLIDRGWKPRPLSSSSSTAPRPREEGGL